MLWQPQLTVFLVLLASLSAYCENPDLLEQRLKALAGETSTDCGTVEIREDAASASECAEEASTAKRPFIVRYRLQGIDSEVMVALAGTNSGRVYAVMYDSMGWSSEGLSKNARLVDRNHNIVEPCPSPVRLRESRSHRLTCFPDKAKRNIMSPTVEPY